MKDLQRPTHYQSQSGLDALDYIEQHSLGMHLGNVLKYALRAGKKDGETKMKDLSKAFVYLNRFLDRNIPNAQQKLTVGGIADTVNYIAYDFALCADTRMLVYLAFWANQASADYKHLRQISTNLQKTIGL